MHVVSHLESRVEACLVSNGVRVYSLRSVLVSLMVSFFVRLGGLWAIVETLKVSRRLIIILLQLNTLLERCGTVGYLQCVPMARFEDRLLLHGRLCSWAWC